MFPLEQRDDDQQFGFDHQSNSNINSSQKQQGLIFKIKDDLQVGGTTNIDESSAAGRGSSTAPTPTARKYMRKRQTLDQYSWGAMIIDDHDEKYKEISNVKEDDDDDDDKNELDGAGDHKKKKLLAHREIERQRRHDMSKLYSSLRNLLPLEFIKGKRAISDHMHQAVNYIQYMQQNIQELNVKRDKLKKTTSCSSTSIIGSINVGIRSMDQNAAPVTVSCCSSLAAGGGGTGVVEVLIIDSASDLQEGSHFPISRVLNLLSDEGLGVLSCTSTKVNGRFFHTIQSHLVGNDLMMCNINLSVLQQKLSNVVNNWQLAS